MTGVMTIVAIRTISITVIINNIYNIATLKNVEALRRYGFLCRMLGLE